MKEESWRIGKMIWKNDVEEDRVRVNKLNVESTMGAEESKIVVVKDKEVLQS